MAFHAQTLTSNSYVFGNRMGSVYPPYLPGCSAIPGDLQSSLAHKEDNVYYTIYNIFFSLSYFNIF